MPANQRLLVLIVLVAATVCRAAQEPSKKEPEPARDVIIERVETTYHYQNDGTGEIIEHKRLRVLTEAGRNAVGQVYFPYSTRLNDLKIDFLRTLKRDGTQVAADPAQALEVADAVSQVAPMFTDTKIKALVAPKLEVGDALEFQATTTIRTPLKSGDFWAIYYPTRSLVVESEVVVLDTPAGRSVKLKADPKVAYTTDEKAGRKILRWQVSNPKPRTEDDEAGKPLFAASTLSDWRQVGEWYAGLQAGRTQPTPEIQALVAKLTEGKKTPREKVDAIYTYVAGSVRYVGIELGIGGFQAHPAADVLRTGYGDCKDKHGLLAAMLEAAGIKAYPVLLHSARGVIEPDVPLPAQFNHVMSVVLMDGKLEWLDTTMEVAPTGYLRRQIRGKKVLLVQPESIGLVQLPTQSEVPEEIRLVATGKLDPAGKLALDNDLKLRGSAEIIYRAIFKTGNQEAISSVMKMMGNSQVEGAKAQDPKTSDLGDLTQAFHVRYRVNHENFFGAVEVTKDTEVPHALIQKGAWQTLLTKAQEARDKKAKGEELQEEDKDISLGGPSDVEEGIDLELAPSYQVDLPLPIHADRPFVTYNSTYSFDHGHLKLSRALKVKVDKLPADRWQELDSFQKLVDRDLDQKLHFRRTSKFDARAQADSLTADQLTEAGKQAIEKNDYNLALEILNKATAKDPKHPWAWGNLGRAYYFLKMYDEAEKSYKKQIEVTPNNETAYGNLGLVYMVRGQYEEAVSAFNKQLEINPLDKYTYPNLASTYMKMQKWTEAAETYRKAVAVSPDKPELVLELGNALLKAGKTDEARQQFNRALELDKSGAGPFTADQLNTAGRGALDARDYGLAGELFTKATTKDPKHHYAWNNLGLAYSNMGMLDEAERAYKKQIEINANDEYAYNNLGRVYGARREYEKAIEAFKKQIEISPLDKYTYPNLAAAYERVEKWDLAADTYRKAITVEPDKGYLMVELGRALLKSGKKEEARQQFSRALDVDKSASVLNNVAYSLADASVDLDEAEEYANSAIEKTVALLRQVTLTDVVADYNGRLETLGSYLDTLGWVFFQKGRLKEAEVCLSAAFDLGSHPDIMEHLARLHVRQDDPPGVLRYYAYATMIPGSNANFNKEVGEYLEKKLGGHNAVKKQATRLAKSIFDKHRIEPPSSGFRWPARGAVEQHQVVTVAVSVDERGKILEAQPSWGDEPFRSTALADTRLLQLPALRWGTQSLKTVREVSYIYSPDKSVRAFWTFGKIPPQVRPVVIGKGEDIHLLYGPESFLAAMRDAEARSAILKEGILRAPESPQAFMAHFQLGVDLRSKKKLDDAIAEFREAIRLRSDFVYAHANLASALDDKGDRAGAVAEYREVVRLNPDDPDAHYTLGAQLEAKATIASQQAKTKGAKSSSGNSDPRNAAQQDFRDALEQYGIAHQLDPKSPTYKSAYERLSRKLKGK